MRSMWQAMKSSSLMWAMVIGFAASASAVALLGTSAWLISRAAEAPPVLTLTVAAVSVRAFALGRAVFRYVERLVGHDSAFTGLTALRVRIYVALERLAPVGLSRFTRGDLLSRIVGDVDAALDLALRVFLPMSQAGLVALATVAFVWWLVPGYGVVLAILSLVMLLGLPAWAAFVSTRAQRKLAPLNGELSTACLDALTSSMELTVFGAATRARNEVKAIDGRMTNVARNQAWSLGSTAGLSGIALGLAVTSALVIGIPSVVNGSLAPVWLAVVALLPLALFEILATLPSSALTLAKVSAAAQRLDAVESEPLPVQDEAGVIADDVSSRWTLTNVNARWTDTGPWVLKDVSLEIHPGQRIAIVGPSGSGKSTLAAVLMRFLDYEGSITIGDGLQVRDIDGDSLRASIGFLGQSQHIFDTTLADNLRLGKPNATDQELHEVLRRVNLTDWVARLPDGLETDVGSFGVHLSGGERQRVALARVLLSDHETWIVDEPTEHLDSATAVEIERDLDRATLGRTAVIITHHMNSVTEVDLIVVMDQGRIVTRGSHEQLLDESDWYAAQWRIEMDAMKLNDIVARIPAGRSMRMNG